MLIFLRSSFYSPAVTELKAITTMNLVRGCPPCTGALTAKKRLKNPSVKIYPQPRLQEELPLNLTR
jgi:hypothetical protein